MIFTWAESEAVLSSLGTLDVGLQDTSKYEHKTVLTLQAVHKLQA